METIAEIKKVLQNTDISCLAERIKEFEADERTGVKQEIKKAKKRINLCLIS